MYVKIKAPNQKYVLHTTIVKIFNFLKIKHLNITAKRKKTQILLLTSWEILLKKTK